MNGKELIGRKIVNVRKLSKDEIELCAWDRTTVVLVLDDGSVLIPSSDEEGNDIGALFYKRKEDITQIDLL